MTASYFRSPADPRTVRLIPLGGCGEFGMNLTAYLTGGRLFVVDCGVRFPDPARLGVDAVLPDVDPFFAEAGGVHAYLLTHGHEDHLGALPHILPRWPAPVYATAWTMELLKLKLTKLGLDHRNFTLKTVEAGDRVRLPGFDVEYVHVNHSIPQTCALFIRTPALNIFHTGDFKLDATPLLEKPVDLSRLAAIGAEGVDLMLADSTNAEKPGLCPSETTVLVPLTEVIGAARGAVLLTTFSSNLWRLKTIADACIAAGKKLFISGNGLETTFAIAKNLGIYHLPESLRLAQEQLGTFPRDRQVILATGCQGEWRSAMARIAAGEHRWVRVQQGDTVVLSARVIPGNEKNLLNMTNGLMRAGARMVTARDASGLHVSGHAYAGDLDRLTQLLKPRRYLPVHGAFSQLRANLHRLASAGTEGDAHLIETGDVIDVNRDGLTVLGKVEVNLAFVDADAGVVIPYGTLRERLRVGELGAALVSGVYDEKAQIWPVPPVIELTGLKLPPALEAGGWLAKAALGVRSEVSQLLHQKHVPAAEVAEEIRIQVRRRLFEVLKKKPVVTVKVHII